MSYKYFNFILLIGMLLLGGCGLTEGVVQKEQNSFLRFTGNTQKAVVFIDDLAPFKLDNQGSKNSNITYEVASGKRSIIVKKMGIEVVNRIVLLGDGITKEIQIP
jgi:hypothetical protein